MRREKPHGSPASVLDEVRSSAAVMSLCFCLGAGAFGQTGEQEEAAAQDDTPVPEQEATQGEAEAAPEDGAPAADPEEVASEATVEEVEVTAPELPEEEAEELGVLSEPVSRHEISGYANLRTRSRFAEDHDEDDHDLYGVLGTDFVVKGSDPWGVHVMLRGAIGITPKDPDSVFYSVQDSYKNSFDGRIYHAYVDTPFTGDSLRLARIGRMVIYETPATAYFDGAQLETAPYGATEFVVGAYGGNSVHLFESWPSDQWMGGLYSTLRPWHRGLFRVDWMRLGDDVRYGEGDNDLLSFGLDHNVTDDLRVEGDYSVLDGKGNDLRVKGFWMLPEQELTVRLSYYRLLEAQNNLSYELNPYYNILNTYYPFDQGQLVVSKIFGDAFELFGGADIRRVEQEADIGRFNRDFDRYYLTAAMPELLPLRTTLSLTGEVWDSPGNDVQTWGLDLTSRLSEETKASIGSYYSLYKYYFDVSEEREDVRTFYAEVKNDLSESMRIMARYEFENEPIDSFHSIRLGVSWQF